MNSIEIELNQDKAAVRRSLTRWLLEKAQSWINSLLAAELDDHLERKRYAPVPADEAEPNYRNGFRPRQLNLLGLGVLRLRVARDRRGTFRSRLLPERKAQDEAFEAFVAECFLAGLSTRDITRLSAKHLGKRYVRKKGSGPFLSKRVLTPFFCLGYNPDADFSHDGCVDLADLAELLAHYGEGT